MQAAVPGGPTGDGQALQKGQTDLRGPVIIDDDALWTSERERLKKSRSFGRRAKRLDRESHGHRGPHRMANDMLEWTDGERCLKQKSNHILVRYILQYSTDGRERHKAQHNARQEHFLLALLLAFTREQEGKGTDLLFG